MLTAHIVQNAQQLKVLHVQGNNGERFQKAINFIYYGSTAAAKLLPHTDAADQ